MSLHKLYPVVSRPKNSPKIAFVQVYIKLSLSVVSRNLPSDTKKLNYQVPKIMTKKK